MKRILLAALAITATALALMAAESGGELGLDGAATDSFQLTVMGPRSGVMGGVVKNAPYSGEEVNTQDNTLGDGTKLHTEAHTKVYRDSEGRTRRETDDMINIYDPVAGVAYVLNPKTMTGRQMKVSTVAIIPDGMTTKTLSSGGNVSIDGRTTGSGPDGKVFFYQTNTVEAVASGDDPEAAPRAGKLALEKMAAAQAAKSTDKMVLDKLNAEMDQIKADTQARMEIIRMADGTSDGGAYSFGAGTYTMKTTARAAGKKESLGTQVLEGVLAEGVRTTSTLEMGAIGNDRPINVVSERWMSSDLKTVVMTKHSDPRSGEEVFRLTSVNRSEPDPALFQLPSGYMLAGEKKIVPR
jgi:hypothetical protein